VALFTALFRPLLLEARSLTTAINAVETTLVILVILRSWVIAGPRRLWRLVMRSPALAFCLVYTLGLALGVGLGTTNLGTLSRYRMPLMPFFAVVLVAWMRERRSSAGVSANSVLPSADTNDG